MVNTPLSCAFLSRYCNYWQHMDCRTTIHTAKQVLQVSRQVTERSHCPTHRKDRVTSHGDNTLAADIAMVTGRPPQSTVRMQISSIQNTQSQDICKSTHSISCNIKSRHCLGVGTYFYGTGQICWSQEANVAGFESSGNKVYAGNDSSCDTHMWSAGEISAQKEQ